MEFKTKAQEEVYQRVNGFLTEIFGEMIKKPDGHPVFLLMHGTALTQIVILPWSDDDAVMMVRAYVNYGADLAPDLLKFLLRKNAEARFGAFRIDSDGDICFEYSIPGMTCVKEEVKAAVLAVASTADKYDEIIMERWGGMRDEDRMKQMR